MLKKPPEKNLTFIHPLYAILDGKDAPALLKFGEFLLQQPLSAVQIRGKNLNAKDFAWLTRNLARVRAKRPGSPQLIVNDNVELAHELRLGLHLGQSDTAIEIARNLLGPESLIGVSTHTLEQALQAEKQGAQYVGFGPLFQTTSKPNALKPRCMEDMQRVVQTLSIPVVGIGGITLERWHHLHAQGLKHFAMIAGLETLGFNPQKYKEIA